MQEKVLKAKKGMPVLVGYILSFLLAIAGIIVLANIGGGLAIIGVIVCVLYLSFGWIYLCGLKVLQPQEALVLTLFGKYYGVLKGEGFYWVNPFVSAINPAARTNLRQSGDVSEGKQEVYANGVKVSSTAALIPTKKISLKAMTLSNNKQKINDCLGNPIEIGIAVIWKVKDTSKAVFNVDNFKEYLSLQCDASLRNIVRLYPYDVAENIDTTGDGIADEGSLRGSSEIVAERIKEEIQSKVEIAGLEIIDARITYLAYSQEIAAAMLQRQQAAAVIDAKKLIVDGAVGMVEMALNKLSEKEIVELDSERKAAMVSNLLVVLCGNKESQPIVNTGSLY